MPSDSHNPLPVSDDARVRQLEAEVEQLRRDREHMYQRALDAEAHAAFGPMDVDERVRALRALVDAVEDERDAARAEVERLREALTRALDTGDWYVRCLEDVQDRRPVRGLTEAKLGWTNALFAARAALEAGER